MENLSNISVVREIMERFGFSFSKSLGQNFLVNPTVCPRIAEQGGAAAEKGVLEIGAGFGVLTHELAKRAGKVVVVWNGRTVDECLAGSFQTPEGPSHPYTRALWRAMPQNGFEPPSCGIEELIM